MEVVKKFPTWKDSIICISYKQDENLHCNPQLMLYCFSLSLQCILHPKAFCFSAMLLWVECPLSRGTLHIPFPTNKLGPKKQGQSDLHVGVIYNSPEAREQMIYNCPTFPSKSTEVEATIYLQLILSWTQPHTFWIIVKTFYFSIQLSLIKGEDIFILPHLLLLIISNVESINSKK